MNGVNAHLYPALFRFETRILKETQSIADGTDFSKVVLLGTAGKGFSRQEKVHERVQVIRLGSDRLIHSKLVVLKILGYVQFLFLSAVYLINHKEISAVNCHSLYMLLAGLPVKWIRPGTLLIYDTHELETERIGMSNLNRRVSKVIERFAMRWIDHVVVVGKYIRKWYQEEYGLTDVILVRNIPNTQPEEQVEKSEYLREKFGLPDESLVFINQGMLTFVRNIALLANVFKSLPARYHIVFMGYGDGVEYLREQEQQHGNIHYHEPVAPNEVLDVTRSADCGIHLGRNDSLSYRYSLPNKMLEFLYASLPIVGNAEKPELQDIAEEYKCAWLVRNDVEEVASLIRSIDRDGIRERSEGAVRFRLENSWKKDIEPLIQIYRNA